MIDADVMQGLIRDANPIPTLDDLDPDELATFVTVARTRRAAAMQAPTQHPTTPVTPPPQRRRKAWAFAAAFVLIAVAIGIAALVTRDSAPVADEPMAPVTVTTPPPTTSAAGPVDVQGLTWSRVPPDEAVFGIHRTLSTSADLPSDAAMFEIIAGGPGFVAVGHASGEAAVWVSEDGITWSLLPNDDPGLGGWRILSITASSDFGLVAVGAELDDEMFLSGTVWTSEDGTAWSKVTVEGQILFDVTAGGPGLVAFGQVWEEGVRGGAVYTSADGITWNRVPQDPEMLRGMPDGVSGVTVGGPGLVRVGNTMFDDTGVGPAVWTSSDGLAWTRSPLDPVPGRREVRDVVAAAPGLVAVGSSDRGDGPAVWTSPDGLAWTSLAPAELTGIEGPLESVSVVDSQLVAVGSCVTVADSGLTEIGSCVWTSEDGVNWTHVHTPASGTINSVVAADFGLIAVGEDRGAAAVWIATQG